MEDIKKIALYVRVSTGKEEQKLSLLNQDEGLRERALQDGHEIVGIYTDDGKTATKVHNRVDFMNLIHDAGIDHKFIFTDTMLKNGNVDKRNKSKQVVFFESEREPMFDEIWVKNTSRLFRNLFFSEQILNILKNKKITVFFVEQGFRTDQISVDILIKICAIFDQQESTDKASKVRWGFEQSIKNNRLRGGGLYGYDYVNDHKSQKLIKKEDEAEIVRRIFYLFVEENMGIRRVINKLNEEHLYTPDGKPFSKSSIRRIISNPKYAGYNNIERRWDSGVVFNKHSPKDKRYGEYEIAPHLGIEPIINYDTFIRAQKLNDERNNNAIGVYKGNSIYSQRLICGICGSTYISNVDRGTKFFNCKRKKKLGVKVCNSKNVSLKKFEQWLDDEAVKLKETVQNENKSRLYFLYKGLIAAAEKIGFDNKDKIENTKKIIQEKEQEAEALIMQRMKAQTEQELDLINKMISRKIDEIEKLNEQEISLITAIDDSIKEIKKLNGTISETINFKYKHEYNRNDVLDFYSEFVINPDGTISPGGYIEADWDGLNASPARGAMAEALYQAYKKIKLFIPDITEYSTYANEMPYELYR